MRDTERIKRILHVIDELWRKNPDLRLGQLLRVYAFTEGEAPHDNFLFYAEDDEVEERLMKAWMEVE